MKSCAMRYSGQNSYSYICEFFFAKFSSFCTQSWVYIEITRPSELITFYSAFMWLAIRSRDRISLTIEKQRDIQPSFERALILTAPCRNNLTSRFVSLYHIGNLHCVANTAWDFCDGIRRKKWIMVCGRCDRKMVRLMPRFRNFNFTCAQLYNDITLFSSYV